MSLGERGEGLGWEGGGEYRSERAGEKDTPPGLSPGGVSFCISGHISQTVWGERNTSLPGRSRDGLL